MKAYRFFVILLAFLTWTADIANAQDAADWMPDANLRTAVKSSLGLPQETALTQEKMLDLIELKAAARDITDITGLEHATNMTIVRLSRNSLSDISALSGLTQLQVLRLDAMNLSHLNDLTSLGNAHEIFVRDNQITDVSPLLGLSNLETLRISGNNLVNAHLLRELDLDFIDIEIPPDPTPPVENDPDPPDPDPLLDSIPVFDEGTSATRSIEENIDAGTDIGTPVSATDPNSGTLTYSLGGTDATAFDIDDTSGQLKTRDPLDFETKSTYTLTISVSDGSLSSSIEVTIHITDTDDAPVFTDGETTTRTVAENAPVGTNIGAPISATDADSDVLLYGLAVSSVDANLFTIDVRTGQLTTTAALDYETKANYTVSVFVNDSNNKGSDSISVTIQVTDVAEDPPDIVVDLQIGGNDPVVFTDNDVAFTDGATTTRTVAENQPVGTNVGTPISATGANDFFYERALFDQGNKFFRINHDTGQLKTAKVLDFEKKATYTGVVMAIDKADSERSAQISVTINVIDDTTEPTPLIAPPQVVGTQIGGEVPEWLANRTPAIQDAILTATGKTAGTIVEGDLQNITRLHASYQSISSLKAGDFQGMPNLDSLYLQWNKLTALPEGIFDGLNRLTLLRLHHNRLRMSSFPSGVFRDLTRLEVLFLNSNRLEGDVPDGFFVNLTTLHTLSLGHPFDPPEVFLEVSLEPVAANEFKVVAPAGAPFDIQVTLFVANGEIDGSATPKITIPKGRTQSSTFTVIPSGTKEAHVVMDDLPDIPRGTQSPYHHGYTLVNPATHLQTPLAGRTRQVRKAIVKSANDTFGESQIDANDITDTHLAAIQTLDTFEDTNELQSGDFAGLTGLKVLSFQHNVLTALPSDVFAGLSSLQELSLSRNLLTALPSDVFAGLSSLQELSLSRNLLTVLPSDVFAGLSSLQELDLSSNSLTALPSDMFAGLSSLQELNLSSNVLTTLPSDVFAGLSSLQELDLGRNSLTALPSNVFAGLSSLQELHLNHSPQLQLPDGIFQGLSNLRILSWDSSREIFVSLEKVGTNQFKAVAPTGASFTMDLPVSATNGSIAGGATTITIQAGSVESPPLTVTRTVGTTAAVTVDIGTLPSPPSDHRYILAKSADLPLTVIPAVNNAPSLPNAAELQKLSPIALEALLENLLTESNGSLRYKHAIAHVESILATKHPDETLLLANYPNPFNPETWIPYHLAKSGDVAIVIYDSRGTVVRELSLGHQRGGYYTSRSRAAYWDGRNRAGEYVASGIYFYQLRAAGVSLLRKMVILK